MALAEPAAGAPGRLRSAPSPALVLGAMCSVQLGSAIARPLFHQVGPAGAVTVRLVFAALLMVAIGRTNMPGRDSSARELRLIVAFGAVLGLMNLTFYEALDRIPLGIAVAIEFVGPLTVAVAGSRRRRELLWVLLAAAGILAMSHGRTNGLDVTGVIFAVAAGGCWAGYILLNSRVGQTFSGSSALAPALCVATLVALPLASVTKVTEASTTFRKKSLSPFG